MKKQGFIKRIISSPRIVMAGIALISAFSLTAAFIAQYGFGLQPCILCLYQRIPFAVTLILSLAGLALHKREKLDARLVIAVCAAAFAANAVIASYHVGVEQHWWASFLEGCAVPDLGKDPETMLQTIMNAKAVRCDQIAWVDPVFGASMAVYNALLCTFMAIGSGISAFFVRPRRQA